MRRCEVAVVGLGLMGGAAMHALLARGADALGFDPLPVGSARGSSHGSCRVFRRFNFESPAYTALGAAAYEGWKALEAETGRRVLIDAPVLEAGPPGSEVVRASRAFAAAAGAPPTGPATGAQANAAFPAFNLPADWDVVVNQGGVMLAEEALRAFLAGAADRIVAAEAAISPAEDGVWVRTRNDEVLARQVIVAAGPWIGELLPELGPLLKITRQTVGWFRPAARERVRLGAFPVFMIDGPAGFIYGFPDFEGRGVKAARHDHGPIVGPDAWDPPASAAELAPVAQTLAALIPGAAGPVTETDVCLYANTIAADVRPDAGEEFIIDRLPRDPRIIVASPCSGHGAKFASAIGEILARLALEPTYDPDPAFRLDRFSSIARS
ncbi:MAG TPA: N-methyl-L-tryptophan oxidase [Caulobacteraceae bacterium]|nr:N-methyl-L-tryptophan oxidase [Caulobacteraceae bacterium]